MTPKRKNIMMNGSGIEGIREEELKMLNEARSKVREWSMILGSENKNES